MFVAHMPIAYLCAKGAVRLHWMKRGAGAMGALLLGGVAPDADLFYYFLFDTSGQGHHSYVSHYPCLWAGLLALGLLGRCLPAAVWRRLGGWLAIFALGALLHVFLDTLSNEMPWGQPFSDACFVFEPVRPRSGIYCLDYAQHWSMALELIGSALAAVVFFCSGDARRCPAWLWRCLFLLGLGGLPAVALAMGMISARLCLILLLPFFLLAMCFALAALFGFVGRGRAKG